MSWDDERDDRPEGAEEGDPPADGAAEHEIPPPSTYAGRRRSEPDPDDDFEAVDRSVEAELDGLEELDEEEYEEEGYEDDDEDELLAESEDEDEQAAEPEDREEQHTQAYEIGEAPDGEVAEDEAEVDAEAEDAEDAEEEADEAEAEDETEAEAADETEADAADGAEAEADEPPSREQSTDAALAGLRARAAGKPEQPTGAEAAEPAPAAVAAAEDEDEGKTPRAKPLWARFVAASLVIVTSVAAATSISLLLFLTDIAAGLGGIPDIEGELTNVDPGGPQTILILGSDARPTDETARSDTAILLRVDPDRKAIALLSIPRDLKVFIPKHGEDKFNAAYSIGGPKVTLETLKILLGRDFEINHVVNVDFTGFADAVNAIDCVYIDVDRQYYVPEGSEYSAIDPPINAGYQRLCGLKALQYVRYRLEDNDLVRAARQQDFIREARQNLPPSKLIDDREELLDIFAEYTTSDDALKDPVAVLELLRTFYYVRNVPVREVHFPAELGETYVNASNEAIQNAVDQFLGTEGTPGPTPPGEGDGGGDGDGGDGGGKDKKDEDKEPQEPPQPEGPPMTDVSGAVVPYAQKIAATKTKDGKSMVPFDIYYPTLVPPDSQLDPLQYSRGFPIDGPGDDAYRGYKFVFGLPGSAGFTEYFGVSGTNWTDPPILENPSETRQIDGREYMLYYDGDRLRLVGWKSKNAAYWVNNTLLQTLEEGEMLSIATHMRELNG